MDVGSVVSEAKGVRVKIDMESLGCTLHILTVGSLSNDLTQCETSLRVILEHDDVGGIREVSTN